MKMTTSKLIQILCMMNPETEVMISVDGWPTQKKVPLERVYNDGDREDFKAGRKKVLLTTAVNHLEKKRKRAS